MYMQKKLFHVVRGCVIGARCTKSHLVSIAVHEGFEEAPRHIDLHVERYVDPKQEASVGIRFVNDDGVHIRKFPYNSKRRLLREFSFFGVRRYVSVPHWSRGLVRLGATGRRDTAATERAVRPAPKARWVSAPVGQCGGCPYG